MKWIADLPGIPPAANCRVSANVTPASNQQLNTTNTTRSLTTRQS